MHHHIPQRLCLCANAPLAPTVIRGCAAHYWSFADYSAAYNLSYTGSIISTFSHLTLVLAFVNISKVANLHMISFAHILRSSYFPAPYFWLWLLHFQVFSLRWSSSVLHWIDKGPLNNMCPAISIINYNLGYQNWIDGFGYRECVEKIRSKK